MVEVERGMGRLATGQDGSYSYRIHDQPFSNKRRNRVKKERSKLIILFSKTLVAKVRHSPGY